MARFDQWDWARPRNYEEVAKHLGAIASRFRPLSRCPFKDGTKSAEWWRAGFDAAADSKACPGSRAIAPAPTGDGEQR